MVVRSASTTAAGTVMTDPIRVSTGTPAATTRVRRSRSVKMPYRPRVVGITTHDDPRSVIRQTASRIEVSASTVAAARRTRAAAVPPGAADRPAPSGLGEAMDRPPKDCAIVRARYVTPAGLANTGRTDGPGRRTTTDGRAAVAVKVVRRPTSMAEKPNSPPGSIVSSGAAPSTSSGCSRSTLPDHTTHTASMSSTPGPTTTSPAAYSAVDAVAARSARSLLVSESNGE